MNTQVWGRAIYQLKRSVLLIRVESLIQSLSIKKFLHIKKKLIKVYFNFFSSLNILGEETDQPEIINILFIILVIKLYNITEKMSVLVYLLGNKYIFIHNNLIFVPTRSPKVFSHILQFNLIKLKSKI